ncbi:HD domain-containing phosphohydrolase [Salidesulfovibrio brasiliensis]|uniref:HD domain-containing phosphohydrolase n=1 Tax=Salidesulfovibrio brasiliensis TaxID=221711 RepID=UPI0009F8F118|nr:HD domain-containing phosphohydrolase [Salidesulfovibrio brasiliensis]
MSTTNRTFWPAFAGARQALQPQPRQRPARGALHDNQGRPFCVVVSDLKMPEIDGINLLSMVKKHSPDTVRIILTGHADLDSAISAVNEGSVFRFLTKPCDTETLIKTVDAGLKQYRLVTAEKELLRGTLRGSVKLLTDILALINPEAFGRAERIKHLVIKTAKQAGLENPWRFELASMLSMVGYVSVDPDILTKKFTNQPLSPEEEQMLAMHSAIASGLLSNIPRMNDIIAIVSAQDDRLDENPEQPPGARLLRLANDYDALERSGLGKEDSIEKLRKDEGCYDPHLLDALEHVIFIEEGFLPRSLPFNDLRPGMFLAMDVTTPDGVLLMAKGQEFNEVSLLRLRNFARNNSIKEPIHVRIPLDRDEKE